MNFEYKSISTKGFIDYDRDEGIITAIVSVTGIEDNVKDVIEPGAFAKTMEARKPKGIWSHDWKVPVARTLEMKELFPGDSELPPTLANGDPWPSTAGAVKVRTQFNLNTPEGKSAFENVLFYEDDQEWSIGYQVPPQASTRDTKGVRHIKELNWFEYSPVLFGAMSNARSVKEMAHENLLSVKSILGEEAFREEVKSIVPSDISDADIETKSGLEPGSIEGLIKMQNMIEGILVKVAPDYDDEDEEMFAFDEGEDDEDYEDDEEDDYDDDDEEDGEEKKSFDRLFRTLEFKGYDTAAVRTSIDAMNYAAYNNDLDGVEMFAKSAMAVIERDIMHGEPYSLDLAELAEVTAESAQEAENESFYDPSFDPDDILVFEEGDDGDYGSDYPMVVDEAEDFEQDELPFEEEEGDLDEKTHLRVGPTEFKSLLMQM